MTNCSRAGGYAGSNYPFLTSKERDNETGLDYFQARYYSSTHGRFVSPDLPFADQSEGDPQSWNLYTYVGNNPINYTDPFGLWHRVDCDNGGVCWQADDGDTWATFARDTGYSETGLKRFFEGEKIAFGQVFDVSGFESWIKAQPFGHALLHGEQGFDYSPPMGGGLRNVTKAAAQTGLFSRIAKWFGFGGKAGAGKLVGSLDGLTQAERSMVQELLAGGRTVQIIPRSTGKTADFIIDGAVTELKTLQSAGPTTVKNAIQAASKQGQHILIDARNVSLTPSEAAQQIQRAQGNIGGLQGRVTVLTKDGPVKF